MGLASPPRSGRAFDRGSVQAGALPFTVASNPGGASFQPSSVAKDRSGEGRSRGRHRAEFCNPAGRFSWYPREAKELGRQFANVVEFDLVDPELNGWNLEKIWPLAVLDTETRVELSVAQSTALLLKCS